MKALSLKQPYAELVVSGRKTIELRTWRTKFRGEFLIHASKQADNKAMERFGFSDLPKGCIVGKATLIDIKEYPNTEEHRRDKDKHLASSDWGSVGFVLKDARRFDKPISCRGTLNFWEFTGKLV